MGHTVDKCFKKQRDEEEKKPKAVSFATKESEIPDETPIADYALATTEKVLTTSAATTNSTKFLLDSASTCHIVTDASWCQNVRHTNITITVGNGNKIKCHIIGDIVLRLTNGLTLKLVDVRIVPTFGLNILSWPTASKTGLKLVDCLAGVEVRSADMKNILFTAPREGDELCYFKTEILSHLKQPMTIKNMSNQDQSFKIAPDDKEPTNSRQKAAFTRSELLLWHRRMGHRNFRDVARIFKLKLPDTPIFCQDCVQAKGHRHKINRNRLSPLYEAPRPGYMFHMDIAGPFRITTSGGCRFLAVLVDDYSRRLFLFLMKTTSEFFGIFQNFNRRLQSEFGRDKVIAQLLSDSASYFESSQVMRTYCRQQGIIQLFSPPYTQELNGVAERTIRTVVEMARTILIASQAPAFLFGESLMYAGYLLNQLPYRAGADPQETRLKRWNPNTAHQPFRAIRVWGCEAWALDHTPNLSKTDARTTRFMLVGIDTSRRCYRLVKIPSNYRKIYFNAHVTFNENCMPCKDTPHTSLTSIRPDAFIADDNHISRPDDAQPIRRASSRERMPSAAALEAIANGPPSPPDIRIADAVHVATLDKAVPATRRIMLNLPAPLATEWRASEISEFESHVRNGTFGPPLRKDQLPPDTVAIPLAWIRTIKRSSRKKSRVVARGYLMSAGIHYNDTFAPVASPKTLRLLCALAAKHDWDIKQGDVSTAFLCADMEPPIYVKLPPGFNADSNIKRLREMPDVDSASGSYHLALKTFPGAPQGTRLFNKKAHGILEKAGLTRSREDFCLYRAPNKAIFLVIWVDDFFYFFDKEHAAEAAAIWKRICEHLDLGAWEEIGDCLACDVHRDRGKRLLRITQTKAIRALIEKAGLDKCNAVDTPVTAGFVFTKKDCPQDDLQRTAVASQQKWYRSILASCIYFSSWTRPDISFAISKLSKFMQNPGASHIMALKRLLRYLHGTAELGLQYDFSGSVPRSGIYGYYDASFADDADTRRSTMAYIFFFEGCPISWKSKLHSYITTSTNHSEYCASAKAAREAKVLKKLVTEIGYAELASPVALFSDSQGAIAMNYNPVKRDASKHIDLADHYAREQVDLGNISITHVPTTKMIADILTKALSRILFSSFVPFLVR